MQKPNFERLKDAYAIIDGIPAENFNLDRWRTKDEGATCGTIACAAGWLTLHPAMQAAGLGFIQGDPCGGSDGLPEFLGSVGYEALARFFGISLEDAEALFCPSWRSPHLAVYNPDNWERLHRLGKDKLLFLARLRRFLQSHGQLRWQQEALFSLAA